MTIMASSELAALLKHLREEKGEGKGFWSLRSVADRAKVSDSYLSQLETGQADNPSPDILRQLAEALRHPYIDLMKKAGYLADENSPEIQLLQNVSQEVLDALNDPLARRALLITYHTKKNSEPLLAEILEIASHMDPEKLKALIKLCDP